MKPTPPILSGSLPVVGHTLQFMKDRDALLKRGLASVGPIFGIRLATRSTAVLIGPDYHQVFFAETDKKLSMHKSYQFLKAAFGDVGFAAPPEVYYEQRPVLHRPFKGERMANYLRIMQLEVQQWLDSLGEQGETELTGEISTLVQNIAAHALMGKDFRDQAGRDFWSLYLILGQAIDPVLPPYLPLPKFRRRDQAKLKLRAILWPIIAERRAHPELYDDFLQDFVDVRYKDGRPVEDETILSLILGLMFAGHETTAGQAAWTIIQLLQHPSYEQQVRQEIAAYMLPDQPVNAGVLSSLEHVFWGVQETARMHPSADMLLRRVEEEVEIGDYRIPAGWNLMVSPALAHQLPEFFSDPQSYDPLRFAPERKEDRQHRFAMIGFGGGIHKCTGMNFANNEMAMITSLLFQQFDLELVTKDPHATHDSGATRPEKTVVRYRRKSHSAALGTPSADMLIEGCPHLKQQASCPISTSSTLGGVEVESVTTQALK